MILPGPAKRSWPDRAPYIVTVPPSRIRAPSEKRAAPGLGGPDRPSLCHDLAGIFPSRFLVIILSSSWKYPFAPDRGRASLGLRTVIFWRHMGHIFLLTSMWSDECRHSLQKRWP